MTLNGVDPLLTFVGAATLDALALVEHYPGPDERVVATELAYAGGGPAATAAVVAARLGHRTAFVGAVGDDDEGERILTGLQAEGVDTSATVVRAGARSGASVIVVAKTSATRAISNRPLPPVDLAAQPGVRALLAESAWVHLDHVGWRATMDALGSMLSRPRISYDGGHQVPDFTAAGLDLYAPTLEALRVRYGDQPEADLLRTAGAESGGSVVATRGSAGSLILDDDGDCHAVAPFPVEVVSTLGAGDVFHGALVAGLAAGYAFTDAVRRANAVAALSCRALDGRSAIPRVDELETFLAAQPDPGHHTGPDRSSTTPDPAVSHPFLSRSHR